MSWGTTLQLHTATRRQSLIRRPPVDYFCPVSGTQFNSHRLQCVSHSIVNRQFPALSPNPPELLQLHVVRFDLMNQLSLLCCGHSVLSGRHLKCIFLCGLVKNSVRCFSILLLDITGLASNHLDRSYTGFPLAANTISLCV